MKWNEMKWNEMKWNEMKHKIKYNKMYCGNLVNLFKIIGYTW